MCLLCLPLMTTGTLHLRECLGMIGGELEADGDHWVDGDLGWLGRCTGACRCISAGLARGYILVNTDTSTPRECVWMHVSELEACGAHWVDVHLGCQWAGWVGRYGDVPLVVLQWYCCAGGWGWKFWIATHNV